MTELPHVDSFDPEEKDGKASPSTSESSAATDERPAEPVELDIGDPRFMDDAYDTYADLRAKGPVSRVRFAGGAEEGAGDDGEEQRGFFGRQETFFVTHYDEVIATLLDRRFAVDPR